MILASIINVKLSLLFLYYSPPYQIEINPSLELYLIFHQTSKHSSHQRIMILQSTRDEDEAKTVKD